MRLCWISFTLTLLAALGASDAHSQPVSQLVVLEATSTIHGFGRDKQKHLLVRVTNDGKVEWDDSEAGRWKRQTGSLSADLVSDIEKTQNAIDKSLLRGKLGPYYIYVDTSVELQIRMITGKREVTFLVINPWSHGLAQEPMPKDVKTVICEVDSLHSRLAKTPLDQQCGNNNPTL